MSALQSPSNIRASHWVDPLAAAAAALCAVHCAVLPVLIAVLPLFGLGFLSSSLFERGFLVFATVMATVSLWQGHRRHRTLTALQFALPGLGLLYLGVFFAPLHESVLGHAVAMTAGGSLIAVAHLFNLRLLRRHVHGPGCAHQHPHSA